MAIYVDNILEYPEEMVARGAKKHGTKWCHLMTDGDIEELHLFAKKIGLKRSWFQEHITSPHYDLISSKRRLAVKKGAIEVGAIELVKKCSEVFKK